MVADATCISTASDTLASRGRKLHSDTVGSKGRKQAHSARKDGP